MMMTLAQRGLVRPHFDLAMEKQHHHDITDGRFWDIAARVQDYTELPTAALYNLYSAVRYVVDARIPGDIIECGVHMGGSIMLIEYTLIECGETDRRVLALDTFTGFVSRSAELDVDLRTGKDACIVEATPADFSAPSTANMTSAGYNGLNIIKGDVLKTIPSLDVSTISLLRCDTDTHETTAFELEHLYDRVTPGGVVIIDDYGYTLGCKRAVDNFVAGKNILLQRINPNVRSWIKI